MKHVLHGPVTHATEMHLQVLSLTHALHLYHAVLCLQNADVTAYMERTAPERLAADAKAAAEAKLQKQHIKALEEELRVQCLFSLSA